MAQVHRADAQRDNYDLVYTAPLLPSDLKAILPNSFFTASTMNTPPTTVTRP